jgi:hypothetical protein
LAVKLPSAVSLIGFAFLSSERPWAVSATLIVACPGPVNCLEPLALVTGAGYHEVSIRSDIGELRPGGAVASRSAGEGEPRYLRGLRPAGALPLFEVAQVGLHGGARRSRS